jgi:hypothetical protein
MKEARNKRGEGTKRKARDVSEEHVASTLSAEKII